MSLSFDPLSKSCKSALGAVQRTKKVTFRVFGDEPNLSLILYKDGEEELKFPMNKNEGKFTLTLRFLDTGLYFYYFLTEDGRYFSRGKLRKGMYSDCPIPWQITIFSEDFYTPDWFKGGVMYQIFPDRFYRADQPCSDKRIANLRQWGTLPEKPCGKEGDCRDFFGGNIKGITQKLDYLASLHVTTIYLNPIFEAASNHRYDTADFLRIDPLLGTEADFDELIKEASARGIRILLDGVFNHTGADSVYFNRYGHYPSVGAYQSTNSEYYSWYNFHPYPKNYDCWWGIESLPAVNESDESYRKFLFSENGVLRFWMRKGIGGFRLDVADELPDEFLRELRRTVKEEDPDALILGEVWEDASDKISYGVRREYFLGKELDSVMNYPLKDAIIDFVTTKNPDKLRETLNMLLDHYPKESLDTMMNILGTHDTPRILSILQNAHMGRDSARELLKCAVLLEFTLPGVPCIFYGDENAAEGGKDPDCRRCFDWENTDEELNEFYGTLAQMRSDERETFSDGFYREIFVDSSCLIFERYSMRRSAYVCVNFSQNSYVLRLDGDARERLSGEFILESYILQPNSYAVITANHRNEMP